MFRVLTVLVVAACAASPVLAQGGQAGRDMNRRRVTEERIDVTTRTTTRGRTTISPYPLFERSLPNRYYRPYYRLTPREYRRLRAQGFTRDEVFMIHNASRATALEPRVFADAIYRGMYSREISLEFGIEPRRLTRVDPEWRTDAWAEAVREPVYTGERLNVWW
jgi:hypothetical protein